MSARRIRTSRCVYLGGVTQLPSAMRRLGVGGANGGPPIADSGERGSHCSGHFWEVTRGAAVRARPRAGSMTRLSGRPRRLVA